MEEHSDDITELAREAIEKYGTARNALQAHRGATNQLLESAKDLITTNLKSLTTFLTHRKLWNRLSEDPSAFKAALEKTLDAVKVQMYLLHDIEHPARGRPNTNAARDRAIYLQHLEKPKLSYGQLSRWVNSYLKSNPVSPKAAERICKRQREREIGTLKDLFGVKRNLESTIDSLENPSSTPAEN